MKATPVGPHGDFWCFPVPGQTGSLAPSLADAAATLRDGISFRYDGLKMDDCKASSNPGVFEAIPI